MKMSLQKILMERRLGMRSVMLVFLLGSQMLVLLRMAAGVEGMEQEPDAINVTDYPGELCNRACIAGERRICYYKFMLENYQAMGIACGHCGKGSISDCDNEQCIVGDGFLKGVMSINRKIPGPAIQVCQNDLVVVDVMNGVGGSAAAIHWHGMHMIETPYMDGVPFVTQCPIPFSTTFRYQFKASEPGTHFYHSHSGHHKINGQYGALIVRAPVEQTPQADLYDFDEAEHFIVVSDYMHAYGEQRFPGFPDNEGIHPDSVLINGRGIFTDKETLQRTKVPPTVFKVESGKRYRFRLINAVSHACPFLIQIQDHSLTIISSDGYDVLPRTFDSLVFNSGERYDFIVTANHSGGDFWIRVRGLGICTESFMESYALLKYQSNEVFDSSEDLNEIPEFPNYEDTYPLGEILNHPNTSCYGDKGGYCISELFGYDEDPELRYAKPDHQFFIAFKNYVVSNNLVFQPGTYRHFLNLAGNTTVVGSINNLTLVFPSYPLLTQPENIEGTQFCDSSSVPEECEGQTFCACVHRIAVPLNSIVELILVDESRNVGRMHHPFHLHGFRLMVVGLDQHPDTTDLNVAEVRRKFQRGSHLRAGFNPRPPFKDTVSIPSSGYTVVRLRATNPGFWLMHCHYEWHLAIGMGLVFQVGEPEEMVKAPADFPKCGNFAPSIAPLS